MADAPGTVAGFAVPAPTGYLESARVTQCRPLTATYFAALSGHRLFASHCATFHSCYSLKG